MSPKSPRIELSNDTFDERKCCEVFAYESETYHRRRSNGISHREDGEQTPKTSPSPGMTWTPSNTAMPRLTTRTTPNRSSDGSGNVAHRRRKVPIGYNGMPQICPQYPFPWTDRQTPSSASFLDPSNLR